MSTNARVPGMFRGMSFMGENEIEQEAAEEREQFEEKGEELQNEDELAKEAKEVTYNGEPAQRPSIVGRFLARFRR
jgi:hypothetical protein